MTLHDELSRCDREIADRMRSLRAGEIDLDPPGAWQLLGLHDWSQERKLILEEINQ